MGTISHRLACLDQLILAKEQLEHRDPANGRMAHILTDNAVELMLHYQAVYTVRDKFCYPEISNLNESQETDFLGRHFDPKVRLAKKLGIFGNEEAEYVSINHEYRNEVYHTGICHERIIWDLAWSYHSFATQLLPKIKMGLSQSWEGGKEVSPRLKRFISTEDDLAHGDIVQNIGTICDTVCDKLLKPTECLGHVLGQSISDDLKSLDKALSWIEKADGKPFSRNEIIVRLQLWSVMFDEERKKKCSRKPCGKSVEELQSDGVTEPVDIVGMFLEPPITKDPIEKWRKRSTSLKNEKNDLTCLKKYHSLRIEMNDLYEDVQSHASALEGHLEYLRGK